MDKEKKILKKHQQHKNQNNVYIKDAPNSNEGIIHNIKWQARKNIRGIEVPARKINDTNRSRLTQSLGTIAETKKINQRNIMLIKHPYIRTSNKNTIPSISKSSNLPRIKPTNNRKKIQRR